MKILLFVCAALFIVSCSTTQEPSDDPWASLEFIVTSRLEYGQAEPNILTVANAYFWGDGEFVSPTLVKVNDQPLEEMSEGNFSLDSPKVPDTPFTVHWFVKRFLGSEIDRELKLPSVLQFLDVKNGDTISASQGTALRHTGSSPSKLQWWIESVHPEVDTTSIGSLQENDGQLELTSTDLERLKANRQYRLFIVSDGFVHEQLGSADVNYSLYSEAIMEFYLKP